jgi:hypothetical protein
MKYLMMKHIFPLLFVPCLGIIFPVNVATTQERFVTVSERQLPIAYDVDVLFVGGSMGNIAAAIEAQKATMLVPILARI